MLTRVGDHLLDRATATLNNPAPGLAASTRLRLVSWYARAALEALVLDRLATLIDPNPPDMPMAHSLICLRALDPNFGRSASYAWWGLSRVCHYHAFELTPTEGEVHHFLKHVERLSAEHGRPTG